jgi:SAM-dependent methyltransferase
MVDGDSFDAVAGQAGLEDHFERWFDQVETDFRATSLNRLILGLLPPGRILDIGCGSGALGVAMLRAGRDVTLQDPSTRMLALCRAYLERQGFDGSRARLGGVEEIPERGVFDGVAALDVIEHIEDDVGALGAMHAALQREGRLVVSVPAIPSLYGPKDIEVGHYRRYDRAQLISTLDRAGFEPTSCRYWNLIGVPPVWLSVRRKRRLSEEFRYSRSVGSRAIAAFLRSWFRLVEGSIRPPLGLTLIATARPRC